MTVTENIATAYGSLPERVAEHTSVGYLHRKLETSSLNPKSSSPQAFKVLMSSRSQVYVTFLCLPLKS